MGNLRDFAARLRDAWEADDAAEREAAALAERAAFYARFHTEAAAALVEREPDPIEAAERAALFGPEAAPNPYWPGDPDPLRDGLLAGFFAHRRKGR